MILIQTGLFKNCPHDIIEDDIILRRKAEMIIARPCIIIVNNFVQYFKKTIQLLFGSGDDPLQPRFHILLFKLCNKISRSAEIISQVLCYRNCIRYTMVRQSPFTSFVTAFNINNNMVIY